MTGKNLMRHPFIGEPRITYYNQLYLEQPTPKMITFLYLHTMMQDYDNLTALSYWGKELSCKVITDQSTYPLTS